MSGDGQEIEDGAGSIKKTLVYAGVFCYKFCMLNKRDIACFEKVEELGYAVAPHSGLAGATGNIVYEVANMSTKEIKRFGTIEELENFLKAAEPLELGK